jgi:DNA polymerase I-like protein with 3'-5' exonuclease and polymerase domains
MKHSLQHGDIHHDTACVLFDKSSDELIELKKADQTQYKAMRYTGKRYNHASAYRMGYQRAAQVINQDSDKSPYVVVTLKQSKDFHERWTSFYNLQTWWASIESQLNVNRTLVTPYGRIRTFFAPWGQELFKEATAHVPQSTVADHLNGAIQPEVGIVGGLREVHKRYVVPGALRVVNQSHDSIIAEVPTPVVQEIAQGVASLLYRPLVINNEQFTIPVDCEMGDRWGELEGVELRL